MVVQATAELGDTRSVGVATIGGVSRQCRHV